MFSPSIARALRTRGHDVQALQEDPERRSLSDAAVMDLTRRERRAIVTNNVRDYRPLHVEAVVPGGLGHFGIVFVPSTFRRTRADIGRLVVALDAVLRGHPGEKALCDGEVWLAR